MVHHTLVPWGLELSLGNELVLCDPQETIKSIEKIDLGHPYASVHLIYLLGKTASKAPCTSVAQVLRPSLTSLFPQYHTPRKKQEPLPIIWVMPQIVVDLVCSK